MLTFRPRPRVIQSAIADVVGPSIAADNPDALSHEVLRDRAQPWAVGSEGIRSLERGHAISLRVDVRLRDLACVQQSRTPAPELRRQPREQALRLLAMLVE